MTTEVDFVGSIEDAIDQGTRSAEQIHKTIAGLPFDVLETIQLLDSPLREARKLQDHAIEAVYDMVRGINREVSRTATELTLVGTEGTPAIRVKPKNRSRATQESVSTSAKR